jgi:predicted RNA-binding Zn-ribbon protein involved in translation (DUF1610 family)
MLELAGTDSIQALNFECPDLECGAVFLYRRVSLGQFVPPNFCPMCGGPLEGEGGPILDLIAEFPAGSEDCRQLRDQQLQQLAG